MPAPLALEGSRFGRLTVVSESPKRRTRPRSWICRCDCGEHVCVTTGHLRERGGHTRSCGCLQREVTAIGNVEGKWGTTHGHTQLNGPSSRTYHSWEAMKSRCFDPTNIAFAHYGGRGIAVCLEWAESFESFLSDMGERPEERTLDRIDVDGDYGPWNCRWATIYEQAMNKRIHKAQKR